MNNTMVLSVEFLKCTCVCVVSCFNLVSFLYRSFAIPIGKSAGRSIERACIQELIRID